MGKCLSILLNNGAGGFTAAPTVATGNNPYAVTLGDLDGDGDLDIATTNSGGASVSVFVNNGSGGFTPADGSPFAVGVSPGGIVMGDFDEDRVLDLATANFGSNTTSILINTTILPNPPPPAGTTAVMILRGANSSPYASGQYESTTSATTRSWRPTSWVRSEPIGGSAASAPAAAIASCCCAMPTPAASSSMASAATISSPRASWARSGSIGSFQASAISAACRARAT